MEKDLNAMTRDELIEYIIVLQKEHEEEIDAIIKSYDEIEPF